MGGGGLKHPETSQIYRVSIKPFRDYKHLLQKKTTWNKNIYMYFFQTVTQLKKFFFYNTSVHSNMSCF